MNFTPTAIIGNSLITLEEAIETFAGSSPVERLRMQSGNIAHFEVKGKKARFECHYDNRERAYHIHTL